MISWKSAARSGARAASVDSPTPVLGPHEVDPDASALRHGEQAVPVPSIRPALALGNQSLGGEEQAMLH